MENNRQAEWMMERMHWNGKVAILLSVRNAYRVDGLVEQLEKLGYIMGQIKPDCRTKLCYTPEEVDSARALLIGQYKDSLTYIG